MDAKTLADWLAGAADAVRWLAGQVAPDIVNKAIATWPDWAVLAATPVIALMAVGAFWGVWELTRTGLRVLTGKADDKLTDARVQAIVATEIAKAFAANRQAPAQPEALAATARSIALDPALAAAREKLLGRDFAGAAAAVRAAAEKEHGVRAQSNAREAQLWRDLGVLESARGVSGAIEAYEKARALEPNDFWTLVSLRALYIPAGRLSDASRAAAVAMRVAKSEREKATALIGLADLRSIAGDLRGAEADYRAALNHFRAQDMGTPSARRDLSVSLNKIADALGALEGPASARPLYEESLALSRALAGELGTPEARRDLSVSYERQGDLAEKMVDLAGAVVWYELSLPIAAELARAYPDQLEFRRDLEITQQRLTQLRSKL